MNTGDAKRDARSRSRLQGVHPKLVQLIKGFAEVSEQEFIVTEGLRTTERQRELVLRGSSWTMASKHLIGRAVDLAVMDGLEVVWSWADYRKLGKALKAYAKEQGVGIVWGGDWKLADGPHFELAEGE